MQECIQIANFIQIINNKISHTSIYLIGIYLYQLKPLQLPNYMSQTLHQLIVFITELEHYDESSITDIQIAIQCLDQVFQIHPKQIAKQIDRIINMLELCISQHPSVKLISLTHFLDFIVGVITHHPKLVKNNKNRCINIFKNFLNIFTKISVQIPQSWLNPPNGYSDYSEQFNQDNQAQKQILASFDGLSQTLGRNNIAISFEFIFKQYLSVLNDWRYPYSALMLASQIGGKQLKKMEAIHCYTQSAIISLENPYPKVRYACLHLIGMYSDQMNPQFQQKYYENIVPAMIKLLHDPIPRVIAHNLACFTNLFDDINQVWKIQYCIGQILPMIIFFLKNTNTWTQQNGIAVLSSFATTKDAFGPNLTQIVEIANELIVTYAGIPEYTQLVNQSFELLSHIIVCQNRSLVEQYLPGLISLLLKYRQNISESYFLNTWSRLCVQYESFTDINAIFAQIMETAQHLLQQQSDQSSQQALKALSNTCVSFKINIKPFLPKIIILAKEIFENKNNSNIVKENSINLILKAIINVKSLTPQYFEEWKANTIDAITYIFKSIEEIVQQNYQELQCLYSSLKQLIQASIQVYNQTQLQQFALRLQANLVKHQLDYKSLQTSKNEYVSNYDDDEVQSNENQVFLLEDSLRSLQYSLQNINQIYQALLLSNNPAARPWLVNFIAQQSALYVVKQKDWKLLGLNLSVALVEKCEYSEIPAIWGDLMTLFVSNSTSSHTRIRNSAVYGMGIILLKTPIEHTQQANITEWLQCLWNAFSLPYLQDIQQEQLIQHSRDNVVSTLGKLIYKYGDKFATLLQKPLYKHWFSQLPLNIDKSQGDIQQHYLNQLLTNNPGMILGDVQDLKNILIEYASFIKKRHEHKNKQILEETKEALKLITNWPIFNQSRDYLWSNLSKGQINTLTRFMTN